MGLDKLRAIVVQGCAAGEIVQVNRDTLRACKPEDIATSAWLSYFASEMRLEHGIGYAYNGITETAEFFRIKAAR